MRFPGAFEAAEFEIFKANTKSFKAFLIALFIRR